MNIIAFDIGSEVSVACALRRGGKLILEQKLETRVSTFRALVRQIPRPRMVVFEECPQAAWLWSELEGEADEIFVCDPRKDSGLRGVKKSDRHDARSLGERALTGSLHRVWHGGEDLQKLRYSVQHYQSLTEQVVRLKNQFRSVFRCRGIRTGAGTFSAAKRKELIALLPPGILRLRAESVGALIDSLSEHQSLALREMVAAARKHKCYPALRTVPGVGPILCAFILAAIGDPERFRTRRQLWCYAGLAVRTYETGEYTFTGSGFRRKREFVQTRGLVRRFNSSLKYAFKHAAKTLSRFQWKTYYEKVLRNAKNRNNAQLTLARKHAAIVLQVMKRRENYDVATAFKQH